MKEFGKRLAWRLVERVEHCLCGGYAKRNRGFVNVLCSRRNHKRIGSDSIATSHSTNHNNASNEMIAGAYAFILRDG
jgi:hypothetical protein